MSGKMEEKEDYKEKLEKEMTPYSEQVDIFNKEINDMKALIKNTEAKIKALVDLHSKSKRPTKRSELRKYHSQEETQLKYFESLKYKLCQDLKEFKDEAVSYIK